MGRIIMLGRIFMSTIFFVVIAITPTTSSAEGKISSILDKFSRIVGGQATLAVETQPYAEIIIDYSTAATTDSAGKASLSLATGEYVVEVNYIVTEKNSNFYLQRANFKRTITLGRDQMYNLHLFEKDFHMTSTAESEARQSQAMQANMRAEFDSFLKKEAARLDVFVDAISSELLITSAVEKLGRLETIWICGKEVDSIVSSLNLKDSTELIAIAGKAKSVFKSRFSNWSKEFESGIAEIKDKYSSVGGLNELTFLKAEGGDLAGYIDRELQVEKKIRKAVIYRAKKNGIYLYENVKVGRESFDSCKEAEDVLMAMGNLSYFTSARN